MPQYCSSVYMLVTKSHESERPLTRDSIAPRSNAILWNPDVMILLDVFPHDANTDAAASEWLGISPLPLESLDGKNAICDEE